MQILLATLISLHVPTFLSLDPIGARTYIDGRLTTFQVQPDLSFTRFVVIVSIPL